MELYCNRTVQSLNHTIYLHWLLQLLFVDFLALSLCHMICYIHSILPTVIRCNWFLGTLQNPSKENFTKLNYQRNFPILNMFNIAIKKGKMTLPVFSFTVSGSIVRVRDRFKFLSRKLFLEWRYFHPNFLVFLEKCGWGCSIFRVCLFSISSNFVSFSFSSTNIKNRWNYCKIWFCKHI